MAEAHNKLAKQLTLIDQQTNKALIHERWSDLDELKSQRRALATAAVTQGVRLISVPVADGYALYHEITRTAVRATFAWLYGGPDCYMSPWGLVVDVPVEKADELISKFNPNLI